MSSMRLLRDSGPGRVVHNHVLAVLVVAGSGAGIFLAFLTHAPNRLVSGEAIALAAVLDAARAPLLIPALGLIVAVFLPPTRALLSSVALAAALFVAGLLSLAASHAAALAAASGALARTSFGGAFWILTALAALAFADALQRLRVSTPLRLLALLAAAAPLLALALSGALDHLSLVREYVNRREVFASALLRHVEIVAATMAPALLIGVPLGIAANRCARIRTVLFSVLNVIQTVPSIALFGLLLAPLALLAASVPLLARWGISGVGMAPAVVALTLYALLPIVRSTAAGLAQVPQAVLEAASGMGMTRQQIFWRAEAPLALPAVLAGVRVATVQTVGLAVVAALIGAGGLGAIVFQGLLSSAIDLVVLGVIPVVGLAVMADALFTLIDARLARRTR